MEPLSAEATHQCPTGVPSRDGTQPQAASCPAGPCYLSSRGPRGKVSAGLPPQAWISREIGLQGGTTGRCVVAGAEAAFDQLFDRVQPIKKSRGVQGAPPREYEEPAFPQAMLNFKNLFFFPLSYTPFSYSCCNFPDGRFREKSMLPPRGWYWGKYVTTCISLQNIARGKFPPMHIDSGRIFLPNEGFVLKRVFGSKQLPPSGWCFALPSVSLISIDILLPL